MDNISTLRRRASMGRISVIPLLYSTKTTKEYTYYGPYFIDSFTYTVKVNLFTLLLLVNSYLFSTRDWAFRFQRLMVTMPPSSNERPPCKESSVMKPDSNGMN